MAMIKLAPGITEIQGRFGGMIFRKDQCGQHLQAWPREWHHVPTLKQKSRRYAFSRLWHHYWKRVLTDLDRELWWLWSYLHPAYTAKGETSYLTGFNMFIKININRLMKGLPVYITPGLLE